MKMEHIEEEEEEHWIIHYQHQRPPEKFNATLLTKTLEKHIMFMYFKRYIICMYIYINVERERETESR